MFLKNVGSGEIKKKISTTLSVVSFLILTALVFGPSKIYFTNTQEFSSSYLGILYCLIPAVLLLILIITFIMVILPITYPVYQKIIAVFFGLSFLLWFQGNILAWNYGPLDGKELIWSNYFINGIIDSGIWIILIIIFFAKSKILYKYIPKMCGILILIQLLSTSIDFLQSPNVDRLKAFYMDKKSMYTFSRKKNVVLFVLDSFQSDVFYEIINDDENALKPFEGFTYFRNSLGGYPSTFASIPLILTGLYYDNSTPFSHFRKNAFLSPSSLPKILKEKNYRVDIFTFAKKILYYDKKIASNFSQKNSTSIFYISETLQIVDIALFRYFPHFLKKFIYNDNRWVLKNLVSPKVKSDIYLPFKKISGDPKYKKFRKAISNLNFINEMNAQFNLDSKKFTFKLYHLWGVHPALELNENLEYEDMPLTRINYKRQSKAILKIIDQFLNILKKNGIYDQTMILIAGDHGCPFARIGLKLPEDLSEEHKSGDNEIIAKAIPLVLVKPFNVSGEMTISDAPVTLGDIPATVFHESGIEGNFPGISMFALEDELRDRKFYYFSLSKKRKRIINGEYLLPFKQFIISGFSWFNSSWKFSNKIFTKEGVKPPENYKLNGLVEFGRDGNADQYLVNGWSYRDRKYYWTNGKKPEMKLPLDQPETDILLKTEISPFVLPGKIDFQRVNVYVNGSKIGEWRLKKKGVHEVIINRNLITDNQVKLTFELPDAASPASLTHSDDIRVLGVRVKWMKLVRTARD